MAKPVAASALRRFRKSRKWTMTQAAIWYGVTLSAWSRWEAGKRPIPGHLARAIRTEESFAAETGKP